MQTPIRNKLKLWISRKRGIKSGIFGDVREPPMDREDIPDVQVANKVKRGDISQKLRLMYYPSIDVDKNNLYAGEIQGSLEDAVKILNQMGMRSNPTAYVEVTEDHGPDDGSYSRQIVTEDEAKFDVPQVTSQPSIYKRVKRQTHAAVYDISDRVIFLAHDEISAWLQPARHVVKGDVSPRVGVRNFRNRYYDEMEEELPGKRKVKWDVESMH